MALFVDCRFGVALQHNQFAVCIEAAVELKVKCYASVLGRSFGFWLRAIMLRF
jgi:hypothetical protein